MDTFLQQIINGVSLGAIYALIALGYTMVYGVLRLINFAHGDVYMVGAYVGYYLSRRLQAKEPSIVSALLVMAAAMAVCAVLGTLIDRLASRPLRGETIRTQCLRRGGPQSHLLGPGGGPPRPPHRPHRGHGRRLPPVHVPRRDRVRDPEPRPDPAAAGPARTRPEGEGVRGGFAAAL